MKKQILFKIIFYSLFLSFSSNAQVSGTLFRDLNYNGIQDASELGVPDILVRAYDSSGEVAGSPATTSSTGTYSIAGGSGSMRVEFELPSWYFASNGNLSKTSVQFVTAGGTASLGVNNPGDYSQANPDVFFPCYINGNSTGSGTASTMDVLVSIPYNAGCGLSTMAGGSLANPDHIAYGGDLGSVWGITYQRETETLYSAAFLKRHMGLGPGSNGSGAHASGAIYKTDLSGASPVNSFFFSLDQLGFPTQGSGSYDATDAVTDPTVIGTNYVIGTNTERNLPDDAGSANTDPAAYHQIGRVSLGGITISDDGRYLYIINLYDKKLYKVFIDNPGVAPTVSDVSSYAIPTPTCTDGQFMPWAVKFRHGKVYVGGVCNAEDDASAQSDDAASMATRAKMISYVYEFDDAANSFNTTAVLSFPMDYLKGGAEGGTGHPVYNYYWGNWADGIIKPREYSEPILGDIEFDQDGSMILGFIDRVGHQKGYRNADPDDGGSPSTSERKYSGGEILRAYLSGTNAWTLESGGDKDGPGSYTASTDQQNNEGPGGGEFYFDDRIYDSSCDADDGHEEISMGGLATWLYNEEVVASAFDPVSTFTGGVVAYSNNTGASSSTLRYSAYKNNGDPPFFGKAAGIGDVELMSDPSPLEIGNLIWEDTDSDGIQDPGEPGISGVTILLVNSGGSTIGSAVTDANGNFYFSNKTGTSTSSAIYNISGLSDNTNGYVLRVVLNQVPLNSLNGLTTANVVSGSNSDVRDSDATTNGLNGEITFNTIGSGENNYNLDFGFSAQPPCFNITDVTVGSCVDNNGTSEASVTVEVTWDSGSVPAGENIEVTIGATTNTIDVIGGVTSPATTSFIVAADGSTGNTIAAEFEGGICTDPNGDSYDAPAACSPGVFIQSAVPGSCSYSSPNSLFDLDVTVQYISVPNPCNINIAGQVFSLAGTDGTETFSLTGLIADGVSNKDITAFLECNNSLSDTEIDAYDAPAACPPAGSYDDTGCLDPLGMVSISVVSNDLEDPTCNGFDLTSLTITSAASNGNAVANLDGTVTYTNTNGAAISDVFTYQICNDCLGTPVSSSVQINSDDDDSEEVISSGSVDLGSSDLELVEDGGDDQYVGLRFASVNIPQGATITNAYIQFTAKDSDAGVTSINIQGELVPNSAAFSSSDDDLSDRLNNNPTTNTINWVPADWSSGDRTSDQQTADIKLLLQEIVNQGTWTANNPMVFILSGAGVNRNPDSHDGSSSDAAELFYTYQTGTQTCYTANVNISLPCSKGSIGNRVWVDENTDGVQDKGEPGISGVVVELQDGTCTPSVDCPTTITDSKGGYIFKDIDPGTYTVKVLSNIPSGLENIYDEDSGTSSPDMETVVTVTSIKEYEIADFGYNFSTKINTDSPSNMTATGAIGDRVWNDANSNGVQDSGERGIPGITISLLTDPDLDGIYTASGTTTTTDEYGNYIFDDIAPGAYLVEVVETGITAAGFTTTPTADPDSDMNNISEPIIIGPGDVWLRGDFGYSSSSNPPDIGSTVFIDVDGNGTYNPVNDLPLTGVSIALIKDTNNDGDWDTGELAVATTTTDANGSYLFPDLLADNYIVVVTDVKNIINDLTNSVDPDGGNNGYSKVTLGVSNELNENFGYVPINHVSGNGFIGDLVFLDLDGGNDYDAGEPGIEGIEIQLLDGVSDAILATTKTNENGMYFFGNLADDDYKVKIVTTSLPVGLTNSIDPDGSAPGDNITNSFALAAGASNLSQDFGYKASSPHSISGTIWEDTNAEGTLDGSESTRFGGVSINLIDANNNIIATTSTTANGTYSFNQIPNGSYTIEVTDNLDSLLGMWHTIGTDSHYDPLPVTVNGANLTDINFGYYKKGTSIGNMIWVDYDGNDDQDIGEPGLPAAKITLEIDYNNDATPDVTLATISDVNGSYSFGRLLIDEDNNGTGNSPDYTLKVSLPNSEMNSAYTAATPNLAGGNDKLDSDSHTGETVSPVQGLQDVSNKSDASTEATEASYDFGYTLNCNNPVVDYAITMDASNAGAAQTTDYFVDLTSSTNHKELTQKHGSIRSWTYCVINGWHYYYNPMDPDEYLFAIEHGSNTTPIEYVEIRIDNTKTDRYSINSEDATFVMIRDWHIKTVNDDPLTSNVNVRFYFPPNEYKQMLDDAIAQATTWGVSSPDETMVQWFKKGLFDPDNDINAANSILDPFDATNLRVAASNANGNNTALATPAVENSINHIQFNGISSLGGGTAMIHLNRLALPIELTQFEGKAIGCDIRLNWVSETEENFSHYELERSQDGHQFTKIEKISGTGNSSIRQFYQYYDNETLSQNYYRLKMVDLDGKFEYSNIIFIDTGCDNDLMNLYPNPIGRYQGNLNVRVFSKNENIKLQIIDVLGRPVKMISLTSEPNMMNNIQLDISELPSGSYTIQHIGTRSSKIFIIQE